MMQAKPEQLYCSPACEAVLVNRSFGPCPQCHQVWRGDGPEHYRNTAWQLCRTCSLTLCRCVVCGAPRSP